MQRRAFQYYCCEVGDMKKASSIFLRTQITRNDVIHLSRWMSDARVTRFLNEQASISAELDVLCYAVPEPLLALRLSGSGRFYIVSSAAGEPIGFLSLKPARNAVDWEIVVAIGNASLWGRGCGAHALRLALNENFLERESPIKRITAKIHRQNSRSIRLFSHMSFQFDGESGDYLLYSLTGSAYLAMGSETRTPRFPE